MRTGHREAPSPYAQLLLVFSRRMPISPKHPVIRRILLFTKHSRETITPRLLFYTGQHALCGTVISSDSDQKAKSEGRPSEAEVRSRPGNKAFFLNRNRQKSEKLKAVRGPHRNENSRRKVFANRAQSLSKSRSHGPPVGFYGLCLHRSRPIIHTLQLLTSRDACSARSFCR